MRVRGRTIALVGAIGLAAASPMRAARAQLHLPPARAPCSVLSGHPCHPAFCGVFHRGPCFPQYPLPFGEDLRTTIVATDENALDHAAGGGTASGNAGNAPATASEQKIDTIAAMFAALRACWVPPPKDAARHGMQYTVRFAFNRDGELIAPPQRTYSSHDAPIDVRDLYGEAVDAALKRCTPLPFSESMGGAIAGRPIAIRFVDDRTIDSGKSQH